MQKKVISAIIAATLTLGTSSKVLASPNDSTEQSKVKYEELNSEIVSLNGQISGLNQQINDLNDNLEKNNDNIREVQGEIDSTETKLKETKKELDKEQDAFSKRMRAMYKSGNHTEYLTLLLTSKDLSDFLSRANAVSKIILLDKKLINEIDEKKKSLDENIEKLNKQKNQLQDLKKNTEEDISKLNEKQKEQQNYLNELNEQKKQVAAIIESNENQSISHALSVIKNSSDIVSIKNAIKDLKGLLPQISTDSVKSKANDAIKEGNDKIASLGVAGTKSETGSRGNTSSSNGSYNGVGKKTMTMEATAYSGGTLTAMGFKPVRNPGGLSTIAVDPRVIPLGTKVYIDQYGYAIASDTGGAIKGNIIDLYMNSHSECIAWGRKNVTLHIVAYPGEW